MPCCLYFLCQYKRYIPCSCQYNFHTCIFLYPVLLFPERINGFADSLIFRCMKLGQKLAVNYIRARLNLLAVISKKKAAEEAFNIFCTPFYRSKKEAPPVFR